MYNQCKTSQKEVRLLLPSVCVPSYHSYAPRKQPHPFNNNNNNEHKRKRQGQHLKQAPKSCFGYSQSAWQYYIGSTVAGFFRKWMEGLSAEQRDNYTIEKILSFCWCSTATETDWLRSCVQMSRLLSVSLSSSSSVHKGRALGTRWSRLANPLPN